MSLDHKAKLRKNLGKLFAIQALTNVKVINIVASIFFLARDLTLSQIFYIGVFWAIGSLLFEVPSSYLADRWGRKRTIVLSTFLFLLYWVILFFARGFAAMAFANFMYGVAFALFSGTDIALLYDTKRELGEEQASLRTLALYNSAKNYIKILAVLVGAYIGQDLLPWQFQFIIFIDILAVFISMLIATRLYEPTHHMDLERQEAGVFKDAVNIFRKNPAFFKAALFNELVFMAFFVVWVNFQNFFYIRGLSVLEIGIGWAIMHMISIAIKVSLPHLFPKRHIVERIYGMTFIGLSLLFAFTLLSFTSAHPWFLYAFFLLYVAVKNVPPILFQEYFNKAIFSYNRATTLSLTNFLHSVLEIPIVIVSGYIVLFDDRWVSVFAVALTLFVLCCIHLTPLSARHET